MLLKSGSNCFKYCCQRSKMTALRLAADQRHARTVKTILSLNPECYELVDNRRWTFLHYAMFSFKFDELKNILKNPCACCYPSKRIL